MKNAIERRINLALLLQKSSLFLFGPRGVGKTTLIRNTLKDDALVIDLLRSQYSNQLLRDPSLLESMIDAAPRQNRVVVIDEIQKIPALLDEVHRLIEERDIRFLLTGSSARRLKEKGVNLLAGRAWIVNLFPFVSAEIGESDFNLDRYLRFGSLPAVWQSAEPEEQLDAYVQTYIHDEIKAESFIRRLPPFVDALRCAALSNTKLIRFANIAREVGVSAPTVASYYQILEDTLIGFQLNPWRESKKRKAISSAKFYFFDPGVVNTITNTQHVERNSSLYGELFEQFVANELRAYLSYTRRKERLHFWRTDSGVEVDFVIPKLLAIEVKATERVQSADISGLLALAEEDGARQLVLVTHDPVDRLVKGVLCLHWKSFLSRLWSGEWFAPAAAGPAK
jgi:predicted AAA+ superfamily ATPase